MKSFLLQNAAVRIALIYVVFSALWIILSDKILLYFMEETWTLTKIQTLKGVGFIIITALVIYFLLQKEITKLKRAEGAAKESEEKFRAIFEQAAVGIVHAGLDGRFFRANQKITEITGYSERELAGLTFQKITHPDDLAADLHHLRRLTAGEIPSFSMEKRYRRKDGSLVWVNLTGSLVRDEAGKPHYYVGIIRDISEHKRMEQELQKAQKLESIGLLAGGIAHDFNNILTAILGNINLARMFLPPGDKAAERLAIAEQASIRARGLSQQLLTFATGGAPITATTDVPHLVREAVRLALRGANVRDEYLLPEDLRPVEADEGQLNQAFSNLAFNAIEAMPEGGVVKVTAVNEPLSAANTMGLPPGEYVRIEIKDQGVGIPAELQERIFDIYFTTKERGSGLGLAIAFSIIKRHGGTITVDSAPGKGSTFTIFLPASQKKATAVKAEEGHGETTAGSGRILVMDDEEAVNEVTAEMLQYLGYQVKTVKDGAEAVTAYRQALDQGAPFAAVITDLTVPAGMGGKETVWRLLEIDPRAKVIVSSGYANDPIMSEYANYGFTGVIPKPYNLDDLAKTLREVVAKKGE
jgi:two-component system, cell cycle sensor histidine kinase and response regulator CckA